MPRIVPIVAAAITLAAIIAPAFAQLPPAHYNCYYFSRPLPLMNFTIAGPGQHTDAKGTPGTYSANGSGQFVFSGGNFDGQTAVFRPGNPPTIAFMGTGGRETESCQPAR